MKTSMRSEAVVALFTILVIAIGVSISAAAASTHGVAATTYTTILIGFGVSITVGFAIAGLIMNGKTKKTRQLP